MPTLICDPSEAEAAIARRRAMGGDWYDEVWEGVYVMPPLASVEHQGIISQLVGVFLEVVDQTGLGTVYPGANVTDREDDWEHNFRCPDVVVVLNESKQRCRSIGPALLGGPDFLVEVRSPNDKSLEKLEFYASIGVRELLVVDRDTRDSQLFRLIGGVLSPVQPADGWLVSAVVALAFRASPDRRLEVQSRAASGKRWMI